MSRSPRVLPATFPQLLHLNLWPGAIVPPSSTNPLGLPDEVTMALAFLTGKAGPKIVGISPLVKTQFKIWDRNFAIPGLTVTQREYFRAAVDLEILTASVPPPSMGIATDLRSRLLLTLAPAVDLCFIIGALSRLRGVALVEPVPALYGPGRGHVTDPSPVDSTFLKVANDGDSIWVHTLTSRPKEWHSVQNASLAILDSGVLDTHPIFVDNGFGNAIIKPATNWFPAKVLAV